MERRLPLGLTVGGLVVVCLLVAGQGRAHHSFGAEYDGTKPFKLTGIVTMVRWTSPHAYFWMDVKDEKGATANWKFEGYSQVVLNRIGWKRNDTMVPGDEVDVTGWLARDGTPSGQARNVTFRKNGQTLEWGPNAGTGDGGNTPPTFVQ